MIRYLFFVNVILAQKRTVVVLCFSFIILSLMYSIIFSLRSVSIQATRCYSSTICIKAGIRPTLDDVERISKGERARRRGTGSRSVPHRLNAFERDEWELAKKRRFVVLDGTGWRRERGDSPLLNSFRNYCDSVSIPCISLMRGNGAGTIHDKVLVDFSPLRVSLLSSIASDVKEMAGRFSSVVSITDDCGVSVADVGKSLDSLPIWRIPVISIEFEFNVRADARKFASSIAKSHAGASKESNRHRVDDDEMIAQQLLIRS